MTQFSSVWEAKEREEPEREEREGLTAVLLVMVGMMVGLRGVVVIGGNGQDRDNPGDDNPVIEGSRELGEEATHDAGGGILLLCPKGEGEGEGEEGWRELEEEKKM